MRHHPFHWTSEFHYLLAACHSDGHQSDSPHSFDTGSLNWRRIHELATAHRVLPQFNQSLTHGYGEECPSDIRDAVHAQTKSLLHRSLFLTAELIRIVRKLKDVGVNSLTFKGPSLAKLAYGDISSRTFTDIDILVDDGDFLKASNCLAELGYKSEEKLDLDQQLFQMRSKGEILYSNGSGNYVDLHTSLCRGTYAYRVSWNQLWSNRQIVDLQGTEVATFGANDLFLYLAVHGAKHRWSQLNWICGFRTSSANLRW